MRPCFAWMKKKAIQALDRLVPALPLLPGRAERHAFEYYRHGTLSLYAALDVNRQGSGERRRRNTPPKAFAANEIVGTELIIQSPVTCTSFVANGVAG